MPEITENPETPVDGLIAMYAYRLLFSIVSYLYCFPFSIVSLVYCLISHNREYRSTHTIVSPPYCSDSYYLVPLLY